MASPVELSDLPVASSAAPNDLMLLRKGLTDYQVAVSIIQNINVGSFDSIANPIATDLMMVARSGINYKATFSQIGFQQNTKMWFYDGSAPPNWTIVPNTGDSLIAVAGGTTYTAGGSVQGTWQTANATLTIDQIPSHTHNMKGVVSTSSSGSSSSVRVGENGASQFAAIRSYPTGGAGSTPYQTNASNTDFTLQGTNPHNHGNTWRPMASVGIICNKST